MKNFKITLLFIFALITFCMMILSVGLGEDIFMLIFLSFEAVKTFLQLNWPYLLSFIAVLIVMNANVVNL